MASFEKLTNIITDESYPIATRRAAVIELGGIGRPETLPFLLKALSDTASSVRREAANSLQKGNFGDATPALVDALKKEDSDLTRWTLIEALGKIGTESALSELENLLSTNVSPLTRREVQKSIDQINNRFVQTETPESPLELSDPIDVSTDLPDSDESKSHEVNQPELKDQTEVEIVVENENDTDDLVPISDQTNVEDLSESLSDTEEEVAAEDVLDTVIEITVEQDQISHETDTEVSSDAIETTSPSNTDTKGQLDSPEISKSIDVVETTSPSTTDTEEKSDSPKTSESIRETLVKHGSSRELPVLVPNTSVVIYEQEEQLHNPSFFAMVLRPNAYLSKQWVSRSRLYFVLLCLLAAATVALVYSQVQRRPRSPYLPSNKIAFVENPQHYFDAGSFFIQQGEYRSAIEMYELIRDIDSIDPVLYKNLGYAHFQENQYALAVEAYEYYLKSRNKQSYQPFVAEASVTSGTDSITDDTSDYKLYNTLGTAYRRLGYFDKARFAYETAIRIAPKEPEAYNNLAQLYSDGYQQKPLLSEALAYAAVRLNPDVASYQDTLGWVLGKKGRYNQALDALQQAIRLQGDYVPAYYHLIEIAQKSKDPEKVNKTVQKTLQKQIARKNQTRLGLIGVISHLYENDSQKINLFISSYLQLRGVIP